MVEINQPPAPNIPNKLTKAEKRKKIFLLVSLLIGINLFVFGTLYFSISKAKPGGGIESGSKKEAGIQASPTPFPFQEMTIPYLRTREYKSQIGEMQQLSQNGSYTSYLTSYDSDGYKINGQLTIPVGDPSGGSGQVEPENGWPAIVFVHGYIPPASYQTLGNYSSYVDYLASQGFVVFKIDLRGHGDSEGEPGGGYYSSDYVIDVLNARAALQNSDFVNPNAIGLWGHSMAGNVISRALGVRPEIPAIVIWGGAVYTYEDFQDYSIEDNSYQPPSEESPSRKKRNEMFEKYGQFDPKSEFWKQVPVTNYLSQIKGAISLNHTVDDNVVDIGYSRNFDSILDETEIIHELNEYSTGGHNFTGSSFNEAMENTVKFFREHLK